MTTALFIIILVTVSGLVAYAGDHLGRRIGKARMMIFGLRPKYTSIMVAVVTGMVITIITITAMAITNRNFRDMLFKFDRIRTDLASAQDELQQQKDLLASKDLDVQLKQQLIDEKESELKKLGTDLDKAVGDFQQAQASLIKVQGEMTNLTEEISVLDDELNESRTELDALQAQYDTLSSQLAEKEDRIMSANAEIDQLESERNKLNGQLSKLNKDIADKTQQISDLQKEVDAYIAKNTAMREHGIYVLEGQIIAEFLIDTNYTYEQIVDSIREAKKFWDEDSPDNVHSNPMAELTVDQYTKVIDDVWRFRDRYGDQRAVIRIIASGHVFAGETVPVTLKAERYLLIYKKDEIILQRKFSREDSKKDIRKGILEMLESLKEKAKNDGMIFEGVKDAVTFDPTPVVETARKASYYAHDFYINLVAKKDIYNIDYLSMAPDLPEYDNMKLVIEEIRTDENWFGEG